MSSSGRAHSVDAPSAEARRGGRLDASRDSGGSALLRDSAACGEPSVRVAAGDSRVSGNQEDLASRAAPFQVTVRLGRLGERESRTDADLELSSLNPAEDVPGTPHELLTCRHVMEEARAREEERALGVQHLRIELAHWSAGRPVEHHVATRREAVEAFLERVVADRVVDDLEPLATGEPLHLGLEILARVEDDVVRP